LFLLQHARQRAADGSETQEAEIVGLHDLKFFQ
jgi:hypothetical protein